MNKPRCFGSPSALAPHTAVCSTCKVLSDCSEQASIMLKRIRGELNVEELIEPPKKGEVVPKSIPKKLSVKPLPVRTVTGISKKATALVHRIDQLGIDLLTELKAGRNPFENMPPAYMRETCSSLLAGGFTKAQLRDRYLSAFDWSAGSASSHVSFVIPALSFLGVIQERDDCFTMRD